MSEEELFTIYFQALLRADAEYIGMAAESASRAVDEHRQRYPIEDEENNDG